MFGSDIALFFRALSLNFFCLSHRERSQKEQQRNYQAQSGEAYSKIQRTAVSLQDVFHCMSTAISMHLNCSCDANSNGYTVVHDGIDQAGTHPLVLLSDRIRNDQGSGWERHVHTPVSMSVEASHEIQVHYQGIIKTVTNVCAQ